MAANATNTLQATIVSADQNGVISINRGLGNPALAGNVAELTINQVMAAGDTLIFAATNPAPALFQLYVKNNAANGSGLNLIVKYTPSGGANQSTPPIPPGGVFIYWCTLNSNAPSGITSVTLNASGANLPVEYFMGA